MTRGGRPRLLVVQDGRLLGLVTLRDLLDYCTAAIELDLRRGTAAAAA
jgi:hypothetical protein